MGAAGATEIGNPREWLRTVAQTVSSLWSRHHPVQAAPEGPTLETGPGTPLHFLSADNGDDHADGGLVENHVTTSVFGGGGNTGRKPFTSGMKELAVLREKVTEQHRQLGKGGKQHPGPEEPKKLRPPPARVSGGRVCSEGWEDLRRESHSGGGHVLCCLQVKHLPVLPLTFSLTFRPISQLVSLGGLSIFGCEMTGPVDSSSPFLLKCPHFYLALGHRQRKQMLEMRVMGPLELAHFSLQCPPLTQLAHFLFPAQLCCLGSCLASVGFMERDGVEIPKDNFLNTVFASRSHLYS